MLIRLKINWTNYLIVGISTVIMGLSSCDGGDVDPKVTIQYTHINKTNTDLTLEVYNRSKTLIKSYDIAVGGQVTYTTTGFGGTGPFFYEAHVDSVGDSVTVRFATNKCLYYVQDRINRTQNKIFFNEQYDDYKKDYDNQYEYAISYAFRQQHLDEAETCK